MTRRFAAALLACFLLAVPCRSAQAKFSVKINDFADRSGYDGGWKLGKGVASMMRASLPALYYADPSGGADYTLDGVITKFNLESKGFTSYSIGGYQDYSGRITIDYTLRKKDGTKAAEFTVTGANTQSSAGLAFTGGPVGDEGYKDDLKRLWNVKFDSEEFRESVLGQAVYDAFYQAVPVISRSVYGEPYGLKGEIVKIRGGIIYLDVGNADGVKPGQELNVYGYPEKLYHPKTGKPIGNMPRALQGRIRITRVNGPHFSEGELTDKQAAQGRDISKEGSYAVME